MPEYTYKDVIIDPDDPRIEIGEEYYFGESPIQALNFANDNGRGAVLSMVDDEDNLGPFWFSDVGYSHAKGAVCIIRKKEYTEDDIITNVSDPRLKDAIGKTVYVAHKLYGSIVDNANNNDSAHKGVLVNLGYDPSHPFEVHTELGLHWDRIILSKNQPPRKTYAPFDLTEEEDRAWLANSWIRLKEDSGIHEYLISGFIVSDDVQYVLINLGAMSPGKLLEDFIFTSDHAPCGKLVEEEE